MAQKKQINVRFTAEEFAQLEALAAHYGLGVSSVVRMLVKRATDRVVKEQK